MKRLCGDLFFIHLGDVEISPISQSLLVGATMTWKLKMIQRQSPASNDEDEY